MIDYGTMTDQHDLSHIRAVLFDLDGTLVETSGDLCASLNHVLGLINRPPMDEAHVRDLTGNGAKALLQRGLRDSGGLLPEAEMAGLLNEFLVYYGDHIAVHSHLFPHAEDAIKRLQDLEIPLAISTNKPHALAVKLITELGADQYFNVIMGRDVVSKPKPDKAHLLETLAAMNIGTTGAIMVGDSYNDIQAAKEARMYSIAVNFGYTDRPVEEFSPDVVISSFQELEPVLREQFHTEYP